jgi:hypothetical protein
MVKEAGMPNINGSGNRFPRTDAGISPEVNSERCPPGMKKFDENRFIPKSIYVFIDD